MKISIAVSLLILALAAGIGWQDYRRLAVVRGDHAKLLAEAAKLGITMDSVRSEAAARVTKRGEREDKDAIARAAAFAAYRGYLASLPDEKSRALVASSAISSLGGQLAEDGFSSATAWIEKSDLTPDELNGVTSSLIHNIRNDEKGQWIGWIGEKLPPQQAADTIRNLVTQWTEKDYQAAGKWLAAAPATPARDTSVRAYAETIAKYEPATAAQWALTLPAGKPRETTLKNIHRNWPDEDAAGKAAFAEEHGIK